MRTAAAFGAVMLVLVFGALALYARNQPGGVIYPQPGEQEEPVRDDYELTAEDQGIFVAYPLTSRFTVILDREEYPPQNLRCEPAGILGEVSNLPDVQPPLYARRFEGVAPGTCTLRNGGWTATVRIE